ncbi:MAG TPA: DUF4260 domain-containing protein [Anaerolineales bacterium]|jgi:hypothetical protein
MRNLVRLEELALVGLSVFWFSQSAFAWWWYPLLLLAPDLSMLGYLANPALGATTYNLVHHKALAVGAYLAGVFYGQPVLLLAAAILLGHSSLDRAVGYGLKHADSFQHTHLGWIGQRSVEA